MYLPVSKFQAEFLLVFYAEFLLLNQRNSFYLILCTDVATWEGVFLESNFLTNSLFGLLFMWRVKILIS